MEILNLAFMSYENEYFLQFVYKLMIPPLRQRKPDIPALAHYFVEKKADELKLHHVPEIHPRSIDALIAYDWPGNVGELENSIEQALIQSHGGRRPLNFDQVTVNPLQRPMEFLPAAGPQMPTLDEVNIRYIRQAKESEPCIHKGQSNPEPSAPIH